MMTDIGGAQETFRYCKRSGKHTTKREVVPLLKTRGLADGHQSAAPAIAANLNAVSGPRYVSEHQRRRTLIVPLLGVLSSDRTGGFIQTRTARPRYAESYLPWKTHSHPSAKGSLAGVNCRQERGLKCGRFDNLLSAAQAPAEFCEHLPSAVVRYA